jgi:hypothetical protein
MPDLALRAHGCPARRDRRRPALKPLQRLLDRLGPVELDQIGRCHDPAVELAAQFRRDLLEREAINARVEPEDAALVDLAAVNGGQTLSEHLFGSSLRSKPYDSMSSIAAESVSWNDFGFSGISARSESCP